MNDLEPKPSDATPATPLPTNAETSLRFQVNFLLIVVILLTATVSAFMYRQVRYMKIDLNLMRGPATEAIQKYRQEAPMLDAFVGKVAEYARTHPDFAPIAQRYQLQYYTNAPKAAAPAAPAPGTSVPK
jgi:hypothetical protein